MGYFVTYDAPNLKWISGELNTYNFYHPNTVCSYILKQCASGMQALLNLNFASALTWSKNYPWMLTVLHMRLLVRKLRILPTWPNLSSSDNIQRCEQLLYPGVPWEAESQARARHCVAISLFRPVSMLPSGSPTGSDRCPGIFEVITSTTLVTALV